MNTIDIITQELDQKGVSPSAMMRDLGFSNGLFSQWKNGLQKPSIAKLEKIAQYLNCSVDYLLGNDSESESAKLYALYSRLTPEQQSLVENTMRQLAESRPNQ